MYQKPTSPLSIGGVLDDGFKLLRASFMRLLPLALIPAFINTLPSFISTPEGELNTTPVVAIASLLAMILVGVIFYGAMLARLNDVYSGAEGSFGSAVGRGVGKFFPLVACFLLYTLAFFGGSLLLLIPGLILMLTLLFGPYLVFTDNLGPLAALKHSHKLVWGNWWRTAAIFAVVFFIMLVIYMLAGSSQRPAGADA